MTQNHLQSQSFFKLHHFRFDMRLLLALLFIIPLVTSAEPFPADGIFKLKAQQKDPNTVQLSWQIKKNYFLYKDRIQVKSLNDNVIVGDILFPKSETKTFQDGHTYQVYRNQLNLLIPVLSQSPGEALLEIRYQGCADDGFCYPPEKKNLKLTFNDSNELIGSTLEINTNKESQTSIDSKDTASTSKLSDYDTYFSSNGFVLTVLGFLGFGLLLSMTPCVLPMVPVLSGLIVGHGSNITTRKSFLLSLSYVLSMSLTYALIGALVATMGSNLQVVMQSPWIISAFALIFVFLALSMFGFYELQLPLSWQNKMASVTRSQGGGHYVGAAIMGCLSTLILSPCVTAPLVGALGYIAHTGDMLLGTVALFFLGFGMGTPLLLIGLSAGKILPKAGNWMNEVKSFFGVLLIAMAIYLLQRIIPPMFSMALWGSLLIFTGIFLGALNRSNTNLEKFNQSLGIICLLFGSLILIGGTLGNDNPLKPLASIKQINTNNASKNIQVAKSLSDIKKTIQEANGKPVILDFYADWCSTCKSIERTTLSDPSVKKALEPFVFLKVDVTENNTRSKDILNHFNVIAPPTFIFIDSSGMQVGDLRLIGSFSTQEFLGKLKLLKHGH